MHMVVGNWFDVTYQLTPLLYFPDSKIMTFRCRVKICVTGVEISWRKIVMSRLEYCISYVLPLPRYSLAVFLHIMFEHTCITQYVCQLQIYAPNSGIIS
jgi:hypothetical protein